MDWTKKIRVEPNEDGDSPKIPDSYKQLVMDLYDQCEERTEEENLSGIRKTANHTGKIIVNGKDVTKKVKIVQEDKKAS